MSIEFEQLYQHINGILRFLKIAIHLKKTLYIVLFFAIGMNCCFSQAENEKQFGVTTFDATKHERMYRVQIDDYQITELIECKNGEFKGTLTHSIWASNRKGIRKDSVTQKITILDSIVKKLISELNSNGFENLKDCEKVDNCIIGLDGTTTAFKAIKSTETNTASYWELESDYYYNQNKVQIPSEVDKARKLLEIINSEFDLKKQFNNFLNRLPNGQYSNGMVIIDKRKKNIGQQPFPNASASATFMNSNKK